MINKDKLHQRYMRDSLPRRLGGLSATLGRISSCARNSSDPAIVAGLLDEAKHLIEWTAAETAPETAAQLVQIQRMITLWQKVWADGATLPQKTLLSAQAKEWSDKTLMLSGLLTPS